MSEKGLDSKTITKRNVAQSTVIFSVVVALLTLGAIGATAYFDFYDDANSASKEKTIPEMIAEIKKKSELHRKQAELAAQSEDLVVAVDQRVEDMKKLEQKLQKVEEKLVFVNDQAQTPVATQKIVSTANQASVSTDTQNIALAPQVLNNSVSYAQLLNDAQNYLDYRKKWAEYQQKQRFQFTHHNNASMEAFYSVSLHFRARGNMDAAQDWSGSHKVNASYNGKANASNNWNARQL